MIEQIAAKDDDIRLCIIDRIDHILQLVLVHERAVFHVREEQDLYIVHRFRDLV